MAFENNPEIKQIIHTGYEFNLKQYLKEGFEIYKMDIGGFTGFTALMFLSCFVAALLPFIGQLSVSYILSPCMAAGIYIVSHQYKNGESAVFNDFFKGFKLIKELALVSLVTSIIMILSFIPIIVVFGFSGFFSIVTGASDFSSSIFDLDILLLISLPLLFIPVYVIVSYSFSIHFVVFFKMEFWDAMEASRQIITKRWFTFFLLTVLLGLILTAGFLFFIIGIIFTTPISYCILYAAFRDITQLDTRAEEDVIQHLVS